MGVSLFVKAERIQCRSFFPPVFSQLKWWKWWITLCHCGFISCVCVPSLTDRDSVKAAFMSRSRIYSSKRKEKKNAVVFCAGWWKVWHDKMIEPIFCLNLAQRDWNTIESLCVWVCRVVSECSYAFWKSCLYLCNKVSDYLLKNCHLYKTRDRGGNSCNPVWSKRL